MKKQLLALLAIIEVITAASSTSGELTNELGQSYSDESTNSSEKAVQQQTRPVSPGDGVSGEEVEEQGRSDYAREDLLKHYNADEKRSVTFNEESFYSRRSGMPGCPIQPEQFTGYPIQSQQRMPDHPIPQQQGMPGCPIQPQQRNPGCPIQQPRPQQGMPGCPIQQPRPQQGMPGCPIEQQWTLPVQPRQHPARENQFFESPYCSSNYDLSGTGGAKLRFCDSAVLGLVTNIRFIGLKYPRGPCKPTERAKISEYITNMINNFPCEAERSMMKASLQTQPPLLNDRKSFNRWALQFTENILTELDCPVGIQLENVMVPMHNTMNNK